MCTEGEAGDCALESASWCQKICNSILWNSRLGYSTFWFGFRFVSRTLTSSFSKRILGLMKWRDSLASLATSESTSFICFMITRSVDQWLSPRLYWALRQSKDYLHDKAESRRIYRMPSRTTKGPSHSISRLIRERHNGANITRKGAALAALERPEIPHGSRTASRSNPRGIHLPAGPSR